jgi:hypothetical protein
LGLFTVKTASRYAQLLLNKRISECLEGSLWRLAINGDL